MAIALVLAALPQMADATHGSLWVVVSRVQVDNPAGSVAGGAYNAVKFTRTSPGPMEFEVRASLQQVPPHAGIALWAAPEGLPLAPIFLVLFMGGDDLSWQGQHKVYVSAEAANMGFSHVVAKETFSGAGASKAVTFVGEIMNGTWTLLATGGSWERLNNVVFTLYTKSVGGGATLDGSTSGATGFFVADEAWQNATARMQYGEGNTDFMTTPQQRIGHTRAEAALGARHTIEVQDSLYAMFLPAGQFSRARVVTPTTTAGNAACYLISGGAPGDWTFMADAFVGVGPVRDTGVPSSNAATCGMSPSVLTKESPEGLYLAGADVASLP